MVNRIHHVNFLVRDLDGAVNRYEALLEPSQIIREDLPQRGVNSARLRVGDTWIVLLQPYDDHGVPGRHLAKHGEGFFMISYQADDLSAACARAVAAGIDVLDAEPRQGLADWRVRDLAPDDLFGVCSQLTESEEP